MTYSSYSCGMREQSEEPLVDDVLHDLQAHVVKRLRGQLDRVDLENRELITGRFVPVGLAAKCVVMQTVLFDSFLPVRAGIDIEPPHGKTPILTRNSERSLASAADPSSDRPKSASRNAGHGWRTARTTHGARAAVMADVEDVSARSHRAAHALLRLLFRSLIKILLRP